MCIQIETLDAQLIQHSNQALVKAFVSTYALRERYIDNVIVAITNHHVALPLLDGFDGSCTCTPAMMPASNQYRNALTLLI